MTNTVWQGDERKAGVLLPVSALPGPGCIGTMGKSAREFVDFLESGGQTVWQVLPVTPPAIFNSPYASHSVFAGNPYLIDIEELEEQGLLPSGSFASTGEGTLPDKVGYAASDKRLIPLLRKAYKNDITDKREELAAFREANKFWLDDYALYMAIHTMEGNITYQQWPPTLGMRLPSEIASARRKLTEQIEFWEYTQYLFFRQWAKLREYANGKGVALLGDIPIYTAEGSADIWSHPEVFQIDNKLKMKAVAGVPPDAFSADGQRWGNPLYDWDYLKNSGYEWWIERMKLAAVLFDAVRIDHFRAIDEYYAIPADEPGAINGEWLPGPGMDFIKAIRGSVSGLGLIAEDLGIITDSVRELLEQSGMPGMTVLQFAFDKSKKSSYLPKNHKRNSVVYLGTHDNDTTLGWMNSAPKDEVDFAKSCLKLTTNEGIREGWLRALYSSECDTAIAQMQDLLWLGTSARTNTPGTVGGNWSWRLEQGQIKPRLAAELRGLMKKYDR